MSGGLQVAVFFSTVGPKVAEPGSTGTLHEQGFPFQGMTGSG